MHVYRRGLSKGSPERLITVEHSTLVQPSSKAVVHKTIP